jgi:serine/threonine protein kinase/tetratricopeptide (TPR) repeat protein
MTADRWQQIKQVFHRVVELPAAERSRFLNNHCNQTLREEVESLLASHDEARDFIEPSEYEETGTPLSAGLCKSRLQQRIGAYRIIGELGQGGMGMIFLACRADDEFHKEVAIKVVHSGTDTDFIIRRFRTERQILAQLEHPNIARLIDGGTTEDGLPYFVMEYVEGLPLLDYCNSHRLSISERLMLFRNVCSAVQYAHQNLIVHRDLKPGNILVTADGTPKLLDFGIAKLLASTTPALASQVTATAMRLMTPAYASPEQVRGEAITTASDIYSLGVVLYELLTGHRPYQLTDSFPQAFPQVILEQQPERPSAAIQRATSESAATPGAKTKTIESISQLRDCQPEKLRRQLTGDLDNIVLMALRKEPERRYHSVEQLAEDLRRHLEGQPVMARPSTVAYRAAKFIGRHKAQALAAVLAILALITGTIMATMEAHRANRERARAEQRFRDVRKLSNSLLSELQDSFDNTFGTLRQRYILAQRGLEYLDSLASDNTTDTVLLGELAQAYNRLGGMQMAVLHDSYGSLQSNENAVAILRKRVALAPQDPGMKRELTVGLAGLCGVLRSRLNYEGWLKAKTENIALQQELVAALPDDAQCSTDLASSYEERGELLKALQRHDEAEVDFQKALESIKRAIQIASNTPQNPQSTIVLSGYYIWQGEIHSFLGDWQSAAESHRRAGELAEAVWREDHAFLQALRNISRSHRHLGEALSQLGDDQGALESYRTSLQVIRQSLEQNPTLRDLHYGESYYTVRVGLALHKIGETAQAMATVRRGVQLARANIVKDKGVAGARIANGELFELAGNFLTQTGHRREALSVYQELRQSYEELLNQSPHEPSLLAVLVRFYSTIGDLYCGYGGASQSLATNDRRELEEARRWYQKSLETSARQREEMMPPDPGDQETADALPYKENREITDAVAAKLALCEKLLK